MSIDSINTKNEILPKLLVRIANVLLLNADFMESIGLKKGKMGAAIFFYRYNKFENDELYSGVAGELLDQVCDQIGQLNSEDMSDGLAGIGFGLQHIIANGFVEADSDDVLREIDDQLNRILIKGMWEELSYQQIVDLGNYYVYRYNDKNKSETQNYLKHSLLLILYECEKRFIYRQNIEGAYLPSLVVMNQIVIFILKVHRSSLAKEITERLLHVVLLLFDRIIDLYSDKNGCAVTRLIAEEVCLIYPDLKQSTVFENLNSLNDEACFDSNEKVLEHIWCSMMYLNNTNTKIYTRNALSKVCFEDIFSELLEKKDIGRIVQLGSDMLYLFEDELKRSTNEYA